MAVRQQQQRPRTRDQQGTQVQQQQPASRQPAAAGTSLGRRSAKRGESSSPAQPRTHVLVDCFARMGRRRGPRHTHTHRCNSIRAPRPGSADRGGGAGGIEMRSQLGSSGSAQSPVFLSCVLCGRPWSSGCLSSGHKLVEDRRRFRIETDTSRWTLGRFGVWNLR